MKREPISNEHAERLINAAKDGDVFSYGFTDGDEELFTVMSGLNAVPPDQYVPKDVLFDLMYALTEPVEYVNGHDPAGYVFGSGPMRYRDDNTRDENSYLDFTKPILRDNERYVCITQTQSAQHLSNAEFNNAIRHHLLTAMQQEGHSVDGNPTSYYDGLMGFRRDDGEIELGLWDAVSKAFADNAHGHIVTVTPWADDDRIFVRTELPALLKNERVDTINGHPRQDFVDAFEECRADGLSDTQAYEKINRTMVRGSSYELVRGYSPDFAAALPLCLSHKFLAPVVPGYDEWANSATPTVNSDNPPSENYDATNDINRYPEFKIEEAAL